MTNNTQSALTAGERRYARVNATWPQTLPPLTAQEAVSAARRLYRHGMGRAFKGDYKLTTGRRYTWIRSGVFYVNPDRGWHHLVHDISHLVHHRKYPGKTPHHVNHTETERLLAEMVISQGWLDGSLRREPKPKPDLKVIRYQRVITRIKLWEKKLKRADTALTKLYKQKAYYEKGGI